MTIQIENLDNHLELLEEMVIKLQTVIKASDQRNNKFYSILFLYKFFEIMNDINLLIKANRLNSVSILFKAALEVSFDIKNLLISDNYLDKLAYSAADQAIGRIKSLCSINQNPPDKKTRQHIDLLEEVIPRIPEDYHLDVQFKGKSEKSGMNNLLHTAVYSKLCKETHSNIFEVEKRFFKQIEDKPAFVSDVSWTDRDKYELINVIVFTILETITAIANVSMLDTSEYESQLEMLQSKLNIH